MLSALRKPPTQICLVNTFLPESERVKTVKELNLVEQKDNEKNNTENPLITDDSEAKNDVQPHNTLLTKMRVALKQNADLIEGKMSSEAGILEVSKSLHPIYNSFTLREKTERALTDDLANSGDADIGVCEKSMQELIAANVGLPVLDHYFLDGASISCALAFGSDVESAFNEGDKVLDLCAAPGGKSVCLASMMFKHSSASSSGRKSKKLSHLYVNEFQKNRFERMKKIVTSYLNGKIKYEAITHDDNAVKRNETVQQAGTTVSDICTFTNCDGTSAAGIQQLQRNAPYDKILVDAPCSTDRHLLWNKREMLNWSTNTPKISAERQLKLLWTAAWLAKEGGVIVYSTCALSRTENEGVVEKLLEKIRKKKDCGLELEVIGSRLILPEPEVGNFGPIFYCKILKKKGKFGTVPKI